MSQLGTLGNGKTMKKRGYSQLYALFIVLQEKLGQNHYRPNQKEKTMQRNCSSASFATFPDRFEMHRNRQAKHVDDGLYRFSTAAPKEIVTLEHEKYDVILLNLAANMHMIVPVSGLNILSISSSHFNNSFCSLITIL